MSMMFILYHYYGFCPKNCFFWSFAKRRLSEVWKSGILSKSTCTKIRIFKSNVIAALLYGCESWRMAKGDEAKLDTFQHKCLRRLLNICWPMRASNEEVRRRADTETISEPVRKRRWAWMGHVLRMDNSCLPRVVLTWALEGKRKRGRRKETWRRTLEKERMAMDLFLVRIYLELDPHRNLSDQLHSQAWTNVDMSTWCPHVYVRPHCFILTEECSCGLEQAFFAGKISKNRMVCKNAVALAY